MKELTFRQVEEVSGGFAPLGDGSGSSTPLGNFFSTDSSGNDEAKGGTGGQTIAGAVIGGSNILGGLALMKVASGPVGLAVTAVGYIASTAFSLTQEGRDEMRVQNHPATRHLYNADGSKK